MTDAEKRIQKAAKRVARARDKYLQASHNYYETVSPTGAEDVTASEMAYDMMSEDGPQDSMEWESVLADMVMEARENRKGAN